MKYSSLVKIYIELEKTSKKLEKRSILAGFYKSCDEKDLERIVLLSMGQVFPSYVEDLGIAKEMVKRVIIKVSGSNEKELIKKFKETGDLGLAAELLIENKKQKSFLSKELTIDKVFENIRKLPDINGTGSQEKKIDLVAELLSSASGIEARYIIRTVIGDMRIGVASATVRDAISMAFNKTPEELEKIYDIVNDYGSVALMAMKNQLKAKMTIGSPIRVMLADRAKNLKEALDTFENPSIEFKFDGFRIQIHRDKEKIKIFSRRLDEVTNQFPDIVSIVKSNIDAVKFVIEGEAIAIGQKGPLPFQVISSRIQRKYDIDKMVKDIPVQINLFDLLNINDENYMDCPLKERWSKLKEITKQNKNIRLADHLETKNFEKADSFYQEALLLGQEGVIVKNLDAVYQPGKRVGFWLKVKEILEPLDLVVIGGEWGEGKRAQWIGSLILACRDKDGYTETGRMASGLTEDQMEKLTKQLKKLIVSEQGRIINVKPKIVVEIGYEEIQQSPTYPSGYALRFPRLLRIRTDEKKPEDANTLKDIERLYKRQVVRQ